MEATVRNAISALLYSFRVHRSNKPGRSLVHLTLTRQLVIPVVLDPNAEDEPIWVPFNAQDRRLNTAELETRFLSSPRDKYLVLLRVKHFNEFSFLRLVQAVVEQRAQRIAEQIDRVFSLAYWSLDPSDAISALNLTRGLFERLLLATSFSEGYVRTVLQDLGHTSFAPSVAAGFTDVERLASVACIRLAPFLPNNSAHAALAASAHMPLGIDDTSLDSRILHLEHAVGGGPYVGRSDTEGLRKLVVAVHWTQRERSRYNNSLGYFVSRHLVPDLETLSRLRDYAEPFEEEEEAPREVLHRTYTIVESVLPYLRHDKLVLYAGRFLSLPSSDGTTNAVMATVPVEIGVMPSEEAHDLLSWVLSGTYDERGAAPHASSTAEVLHCLNCLRFTNLDVVASLQRQLVRALLAMPVQQNHGTFVISAERYDSYLVGLRYDLKRLSLMAESIPQLGQWCSAMEALYDIRATGSDHDGEDFHIDPEPVAAQSMSPDFGSMPASPLQVTVE